VAECAFLRKQGTPKAIADSLAFGDPERLSAAFECSLCGLCAEVCPVGVAPSMLFLEMRREVTEKGLGDRPEHGRLLAYERRGTSPRYTWYALPAGCDTVFFPGCALPGTRPDTTLAVFERLRGLVASLGIVLDCCAKPSHDLGRTERFEALFPEMRDWLLGQGVRTVLVACPNCHKVFRDRGGELAVKTVYEVLAGDDRPWPKVAGETVAVHDPCPVRCEEPVHAAVRALAGRVGLAMEEMAHSGRRTVCCGEGGAVAYLAPGLAGNWTELRGREAAGRRLLTYCAGCAGLLGRTAPASHLLDALFAPKGAALGAEKVSRAPFTYWNRLWLKRRLQAIVQAAVTRERPLLDAVGGRKGGPWGRLFLLAVLVGGIAALRLTGASRYLDEATLRAWIQGYGALAPAVYVALYAVAPSLLLPGLPFTLAAGVLFGPLWGVAYAIVGSTLGACIAFLVARYLARGWVEARLAGSRWKRLDDEVARQGWKVVAFTRLIPLFPFNLLNFAFGLTKIRFVPYALASFFGMLPACTAFVVFSSSLLDLLRGKLSPRLAVGLLLIAAVSVAPLVYRKVAGRKAPPPGTT
jgi:uncharacterized membrane protein YdjX (TVP38/TMEM64 family)/ferredoxin